MTPLWSPSPNFTERRNGLKPRWVVLHYTAMQTAQDAIDRLCAPEHQVSAHYVVDELGHITQLVDERHRAWHAGQSYWRGCEDLNSASIGIELANRGTHPFPVPQMRALRDLLGDVMARWALERADVIGHSDIAIGRKTDPGPRFDWRGLAHDGFGLWPAGATLPTDLDQFLYHADRFGYDVRAGSAAVLEAFRLHFAPHRRGPLNTDDCGDIASLVAQMPVDDATS